MSQKYAKHNIFIWLIDELAKRGINREEIDRELQLEPEQLSCDNLKLELARYIKLFNWAVVRCKDEYLGIHKGTSSMFEHLGLYGYLMRNSATLGDLCQNIADYSNTFSRLFVLEFEQGTKCSRLYYKIHSSSSLEARQDIELSLALAVNLFREQLFAEWMPLQASFSYTQPANSQLMHGVFSQRLLFNQPTNFIEFDNSILAVEVAGADAKLFKVLKAQADQITNQYNQKDDLANRVRILIMDNIGSNKITVEYIAWELNMSRVSLFRKLRKQNVTFSGLRDEIILQLAKTTLLETTTSISEIAQILGYSEHSAFIHAFNRLVGLSPSQYRKQYDHII